MKIGFVGYPASGHLNPMTALARRLQSRGHEVIFIGLLDTEPFARAAGLTFVPYCEEEFPMGSLAEAYAPVAKMHGLEVVQYTCKMIFAPLTRAALKNLPQKLEEAGGNVTRTAELLGLERSNLYRKMRALGIAPRE